MEIKPPNGISPMKREMIRKYFKRWKKNRYRNNPLDIILYENHIFIEGIHEIPKRFCGECKLYDKFGKLKYDGGYMYGRFHGYGKLIINANEYYEGEERDQIAKINERKKKIRAKALTFKGKKYAVDPSTKIVYDLDSYLQGNPRKVGDLIVRGKRSGIRFI